MAEQVNIVEEQSNRVSDAYHSFDEGFQKLQKDLRDRRKTFEKQISSGRKNLERQINASRKDIKKRTRQQVNELRKNPVVERAISVSEDATKMIEKQIEGRVSSVLGFFNIATRSDVERLERKIAQITRKLKLGERAKKANGSTVGKAS